MKVIRKLLKEEQGSTLIIMVGLVLGAIFISFIFFDFFTAFASKRMSQTNADAAALAASIEIRKIYEAGLRETISEKIDKLRNIVEPEVEAEIEKLIEERTEYDDDGKIIYKPTRDEVIDDAWENVMNRRGIPHEIYMKLRYPSYTLNGIIALRYFYKNDDEITDLICRFIYKNWEGVETTTQLYASNANKINIIFPYNKKFDVYVSINIPASFITVPDDAFPDGAREIFVEAAAKIPFPDGIKFKNNKCKR